MVAAAGTAVVLISLFMTWYRVTITPAGLQFFQSLERALFARLFPQAADLGGLTAPFTISISALGKDAGGWHWAILVVSIVLVLEVLLAAGSGVARQAAPSWPHGTVVLVLTVTNLILIAVAFFDLPYGGTPAYLEVSRGLGAFVGLIAGLVALGGATARLVKSSTSAVSR